jgi:hypothetical protein
MAHSAAAAWWGIFLRRLLGLHIQPVSKSLYPHNRQVYSSEIFTGHVPLIDTSPSIPYRRISTISFVYGWSNLFAPSHDPGQSRPTSGEYYLCFHTSTAYPLCPDYRLRQVNTCILPVLSNNINRWMQDFSELFFRRGTRSASPPTAHSTHVIACSGNLRFPLSGMQ